MSFINGVWRLLGAEIDESDDDNIVEYPSSHPAMQSRADAPPVRPVENIIALPEPEATTISVVRPELDGTGKEQYSLKRYRDILLKRQAMVVDINQLAVADEAQAKRVIDFLAGVVLAVEGSVFEVTKNIFLFAPKNVKLAGDPIRQVELA
jgi:FtsZ-interacting cell division protein YlmF